MAPAWRLSVLAFLPLLFAGVMADITADDISKWSKTWDTTCIADAQKSAACLALLGDKSIQADTTGCTAVYTIGDCIAKLMCLQTACTTSQATDFLDALLKGPKSHSLSSLFSPGGTCSGSGFDPADLGCGDVPSFRSSLASCRSKLKTNGTACVKESTEKTKDSSDQCLVSVYLMDCLLKGYCGVCEAKVVQVQTKVAKYVVEGYYVLDCNGDQAPFYPSCGLSSLLKWGLIGLGACLLLGAIGVCFCIAVGSQGRFRRRSASRRRSSSHKRKSSERNHPSEAHVGDTRERDEEDLLVTKVLPI